MGSEPLVRKEAYQYTLETKGLLIDEEEFGNIIVKALPDGKYLRIRDLATIELGRESYSSTATLKGGAVAAIAVYQLPGANALDVAQRVKKEMDKLASYFPEGVQYSVTLDTTEFINASISGIYETLITAFILVLLVILIFLQNWRAMLIPLITIPVSLVGTFTFMAMLGFSINTLTLFGLVLAIGLVVDDAIIIVENSYRLIETGRYPHRKRGGDPGHEGSVGSCCGYCARTVGRIYSHGLYRRHHRPVVQTIRPDDRHLDGNQRVQRPHPEPRTLCPVSETQTAGQILSLQSFQPVF